MNKINKKIEGYVALTTVIIVGAVVMVITLSISIISISGIQTSLSTKKSSESLDITDGCGELVLREIRNNPSYSATSLTLQQGTCNLQITENAGNYIIIIDTTIESHTKTVTIDATRTASGVSVNSWQQ